MVMDSMTGMLVGSVAYRMQGRGLLMALYGGQQPHIEMANMFNLSRKDTSIIQVSCYITVLLVYCIE
jgi:hypothetical protein